MRYNIHPQNYFKMTTTNTSAMKKLLNEIKVQVAMSDSALNTFETKHSRASATRCRNYLMQIKKHCNSLRKETKATAKGTQHIDN